MPAQRYPRQCYLVLNRLDEAGRVTHVKHLLYQHGFGYVWIAKELGSQAVFLHLFSQRLRDCAYQSLLADIENSPKTLTYKLYKSAIEPEQYLSLPLTYKDG